MISYKFLILTLLTVLTTSLPKNVTSFWATSLGVTSLPYQVHAGFENVDWYFPKGQAQIFYQIFSCIGSSPFISNPRIPLIIWLQGGPGSSSQFGAFTEIGPIRINKGKPQKFASAWNLIGHTLFIDQPLNVGFSFNGERKGKKQVASADEAARHIMNFLSNFYISFPALRDSPLYITGQSFAGHYIPALARSMLVSNKTFLKDQRIKLEGIAIGDGWTDPINQINYYDSYLYSVGVVSNKFRDVCAWFQTNSIINIENSQYKNATNYFDFLTNNDSTADAYWGGMSIYNFRNYDGLDSSFGDFLEKNKAELGVNSSISFIAGNDAVYESFSEDISKSYSSDVVIALNSIKVLIYNGQEDMVVNNAGVLQYLNSLGWTGINRWKSSPKTVWRLYGEVRGWTKVSGNLWFAIVNRAGHMVPSDQPEAAFSLIGHFIHNDRNWNE